MPPAEMVHGFKKRALPGLVLALVVALIPAGATPPAQSTPGPRGSTTSDSAYWYYCPAGLVQTGTADSLANGRNCSFWLLRSFPLGGDAAPALNSTAVPGLDVLPVWRRTRGAGVTVGVVDTGIDGASADLAPNLVPGRNFYDGTGDTSDASGHGTLVASVIAAPAGNGGYVGIAPEARLLPVKVLGGASGQEWSRQAVVRGIEYAAASGARVINLSLGGLNTAIPGIAGALTDAERAGALVVIAAGNDGVDLDDPRYTESPDGYGLPNTLTVADFTTTDELAADSNYGARHVQIASLGAALWGDYPHNPTGGYLGGSSAAAATVSGVAALLFAADPTATAAQVRRAIIVGANTSVPGLQGKVEANGLLSASGALAALALPDTTPPSAFAATGPSEAFRLTSRGRVTLGWQPAHDAELEGYSVTIDGRTTTLPPGTTRLRTVLRRGAHRWSVSAYDLSGNRTAATPSA